MRKPRVKSYRWDHKLRSLVKPSMNFPIPSISCTCCGLSATTYKSFAGIHFIVEQYAANMEPLSTAVAGDLKMNGERFAKVQQISIAFVKFHIFL